MTPISKNRYIDILDDIVTEYKNVYCRKIKMKPVDVRLSTYIDFGIKITKKMLMLTMATMQAAQNIRNFLQKVIFHVDQKNFI